MSGVLIVKALVGNYDKWRVAFDENAALRRENGVNSTEIYCSPEDVNTLLVLQFFDSVEKASSFASNPALVETMHAGGVVGPARVSVASLS